MRTGHSARGRRPLFWALLVVAFGSLLSGCVEIVSSPAPPADVVTGGLGATRREWEHDHRADGPFERDLGPTRLRGLVYDGAYRVTYWTDGSQETAPSSARISRIEFDTPESDPEVLKAVARELLPQDAVLHEAYGPSGDTSSFTEVYICPSLESAYGHLTYTAGVSPGDQGSWSRVVVSHAAGGIPGIVVQIGPWGGMPPDGMPPPLSTVPVSLPMPVPSVHP